MLAGSARAEQAITGVAKSWQDIAVFIEFAVERGTNDRHIRVCGMHSRYADRRRNDAEKTDALRAGALERINRGHGATAGREHRIEQQKVSL